MRLVFRLCGCLREGGVDMALTRRGLLFGVGDAHVYAAPEAAKGEKLISVLDSAVRANDAFVVDYVRVFDICD